MVIQCSLLNDLRGGDHHKRTIVLAGVKHDERCLEAADEIERLRDGIDAIRQYGSDTLSGPSNHADDTRDWQRDCVLEMTNRAVRVLGGTPWLGEAQKEGE